MLTKLIKHEFRATARIMGSLYLVLLAVSAGACLSLNGLLDNRFWLLNLLGGLLIVAFVIAIFAVCIMVIVVAVQRFRNNLLGDEGYLMLTLPASIHQHVWAKLIVSAVWYVVTVLAVILAALIAANSIPTLGDIFSAVGNLFRKATAYYTVNGTVFLLELLFLGFLFCCVVSLLFYSALAVGHSFSNHKMALSVAFFFGFQFASQFVLGVLFSIMNVTSLDYWLANVFGDSIMSVHFGMWLVILGTVLYGAVFYFVTTLFLQKRLNLE